MFNRAHVDDIAELTRLVLTRGLEGQIWNVADDEPAPPQDVIVYAAALLGLAPPPEEPFEGARLSPMTAEFYADNKRVSIAKAKTLLGFVPAYPTYREGLAALAEAGEGRGAEGEAGLSTFKAECGRAQCAAGAAPPSLTLRRLKASGTAASESSISTQKTSM